MNCWLVKSEPETYSWSQFLKDGKTAWTGVRNFAARLNLRAMKTGDHVFFYHSGEEKSVVGLARVEKEFYPDPTADAGDWPCVDLAAEKALAKPVTLAEIKADKF
jgi:predicted RNA-binding protein with PUA-like domain